MRNHSWPSLATLTICIACATVQLYWGGQDTQEQFHAEYLVANGNLGMSLFFLGPYVLLAVSSLIGWRQRDGRALGVDRASLRYRCPRRMGLNTTNTCAHRRVARLSRC